MIHYPIYNAIHETGRLHKRATHSFALSFPKAQVYRTGVANLSLTMQPLLKFYRHFRIWNYKGRLRFYVSKL